MTKTIVVKTKFYPYDFYISGGTIWYWQEDYYNNTGDKTYDTGVVGASVEKVERLSKNEVRIEYKEYL